MSTKPPVTDPLGEGDDIVANFQIEGAPVRGRIARLGEATLTAILRRHDYPRWAGHLLGEAVTLAVLVAASLKFDGKISVQAQGDGPVSLMVAEARSDGGVRGYLRLNRPAWDRLDQINKGARPHIPQLFGQGVLALILAPADPNQSAYQGIVPIEKGTLAECAQDYFEQSEQIPTRVHLTVAELSTPGGARSWRAGGALIQQVAGDDARGDTEDAWETAQAHFATLSDLEMADPDLSAGRLLFRLYHESGVRLEPPSHLVDACTCSEEKLRGMLQTMSRDEAASLADEAGIVSADCQFCSRSYRFALSDL